MYNKLYISAFCNLCSHLSISPLLGIRICGVLVIENFGEKVGLRL